MSFYQRLEGKVNVKVQLVGYTLPNRIDDIRIQGVLPNMLTRKMHLADRLLYWRISPPHFLPALYRKRLGMVPGTPPRKVNRFPVKLFMYRSRPQKALNLSIELQYVTRDGNAAPPFPYLAGSVTCNGFTRESQAEKPYVVQRPRVLRGM